MNGRALFATVRDGQPGLRELPGGPLPVAQPSRVDDIRAARFDAYRARMGRPPYEGLITMSAPQRSRADDTALLNRARGGDEDAFGALVEPHRAQLRTHAYRLLGSVHDAEDALQEALLRAWRGLSGFEGRSSVRSWLYSIVTNAALDVSRRSSRRELPVDFGPAAGPGEDLSAPLADPVWLEPYPDRWLTGQAGSSPEAAYEQRESVELAFIVVLQKLPPLQRAVLILREVAGFSAAEVSGQLGTSVPSVNSALQRARATARSGLPARSQQSTLRALGDQRTRAIVEQYMDAMARGDTDTLVSMLTEDAIWSMPPVPTWFQGHQSLREFLARYPHAVRWKHRPARANGQLAVGCYIFDQDQGNYAAAVIDVLTLEGDKISSVVGFHTDVTLGPVADGWVAGAEVFSRFGLPAALD
jgi:RNA polymerase sigma-70 factor, ECF subfamily